MFRTWYPSIGVNFLIAVPLLLEILRSDEDSLLRWMAQHELQCIDSPDPSILEALHAAQQDTGLQEYAAAA